MSTLGFVYYVKLEDGSLIKRFEVRMGGGQGGKGYGDGEGEDEERGGSSTFSRKKRPHSTHPHPSASLLPRLIHYHPPSKILLVIL